MTTVINGSSGINLDFSTGGRITGDFSNATFTNRAMFQTSTVNGNTLVASIPNGTAVTTGFRANTSTDADNTSFFQALAVGSDSIRLYSDKLGTGSYLPMLFYTGGSERMRIDTSGNVGIGLSSTSNGRINVQAGTSSTGNSLFMTNIDGTYNPFIQFQHNGVNGVKIFSSSSSGGTAGNMTLSPVANLIFEAGGAERARIDSSGYMTVGSPSMSPFSGTTATQQLIVGRSVSDYTFAVNNTNSQPYGIFVAYNTDTNNTGSSVIDFRAGSNVQRFAVRSNGGIANYSANNVNLSDERTKTAIVAAGSYLDKICAIPVRTFKYKDQTDDLLNLGVIAQEVEAVAPELVDVSGFGETPEDGVPLKAIYQTDLQYALMKCIQEQQAIIETLKARLDAANL